MNVCSAIRAHLKRDREGALAEIRRVIDRHRGSLKRVAWDFAIRRRAVIYLMEVSQMWGYLAEVREANKVAARPEPSWIVRTREALS